jgi:hypothetical protein
VIKCGIPQGSVLGPILFPLYINDLPQIINEKAVLILFANDPSILLVRRTHYIHFLFLILHNTFVYFLNLWLFFVTVLYCIHVQSYFFCTLSIFSCIYIVSYTVSECDFCVFYNYILYSLLFLSRCNPTFIHILSVLYIMF